MSKSNRSQGATPCGQYMVSRPFVRYGDTKGAPEVKVILRFSDRVGTDATDFLYAQKRDHYDVTQVTIERNSRGTLVVFTLHPCYTGRPEAIGNEIRDALRNHLEVPRRTSRPGSTSRYANNGWKRKQKRRLLAA